MDSKGMGYVTGCWRLLLLGLWVLAVSACSSSGGSSSSSSSQISSSSSSSSSENSSSSQSSSSSSESGEPVLTLVPTAIKTFAFSWPAVTGATEYVLLEDADGSSGFSEIARLPASSIQYDHSVSLPHRINARYLLQACDGLDCRDSAPVHVSGNLAEAVGYVKAAHPGVGDWFGWALALSGDGSTLAVGAPRENSSATGIDSGAADSGAVYVFYHSDTGWQQQAYIKASNADVGDQFGSALALSYTGSTLAVGSWRESSSAQGIGGNQNNNDALNSGAVYVFTRVASDWQQQAYIKAINARANRWFGASVALSDSGDILAVGAPLDDSAGSGVNGSNNPGFISTGAAYILERIGGIWQHQTFIKPDSEHDQRFGDALALSGDGATLAVGAYLESSNATGINGSPVDTSVLGAGAVYVYANALGMWSKQAYIKADVARQQQRFGWSLALDEPGNTLVVGAPGDNSGTTSALDTGMTDSGAAYVFTRSAGLWSKHAYLKASNRHQDDLFGWQVAVSASGQRLLVGATGEWVDAVGINGDASARGDGSSGAAYLFTRDGANWQEYSYIKASNTGGFGAFGYALGMSANGDTLAVSDPFEGGSDGGVGADQSAQEGFDNGAVYLY